MEERVPEVLYEERLHASRSFPSTYPPQHQQVNEGVKSSFLSLLSARGISQLKEKWREYRQPEKLRKLTSLFVSPRGERVAVAVGNQITILRKDDDYQEPCGLFTGSGFSTFTCGTWSEAHDVLGVADDLDIIYFIRANGEEICRITKESLKISVPIKGLILEDDFETKSYMCTFSLLAADGLFHDIEICQDPSASISSAHTLSGRSNMSKQFPQNVSCFDYHQEISLLAVVGNAVGSSLTSSGSTGSCDLSLWHRSSSFVLEQVISTQFEGLYSKPKGYIGQLTSPKVQISPHGKFVATQDLRGCLVAFKLDGLSSLSKLSCAEEHDSMVVSSSMVNWGMESLGDINDFTWWSDHVLTVVKRSGTISMIDVLTSAKLLKNDPVYSMPIVERVQLFPGHIFLLESNSSDENYDLSGKNEASDLHLVQHVIVGGKYNQLSMVKLRWKLISFSEKSILEMYKLLISNQKYQDALDFANQFGLDKDEVLKSQWIHSEHGVNEVNTLLSSIRDQVFALAECVDRVGRTEDAMRALLDYGLRLTNQCIFTELGDDMNGHIWDFRLARLKLLQSRDKLETYLGVNMGRFSEEEYKKFRLMPINEAAVSLAESGKIGALNLLFKRHPYSLTSFMLEVLAAIPETVPVQTYGQLLPGNSPPSSIGLRVEDWVESEKMVKFISRLSENVDNNIQIRTEPIVKQCLGMSWPSASELSTWYKSRARDIDALSGQLDNCLNLIEFACRRGICELQPFHEDISFLSQLIYSDGSDDELKFTMSLTQWEQLTNYDRFKLMLKGIKEENLVRRLHEKAIPFMRKKLSVTIPSSMDQLIDGMSSMDETTNSFLVRWLKETALENNLHICSMVFEEGCRELLSNGFFRDEVEVVDCALQCIYLCTGTDRWSTMALILSRLPNLQDTQVEGLRKRLKLAEGHIEAGRLLAYYQVPKPISYFPGAHSDGKGVKQILRLILSKFTRRQPGRSDNDWANMWCDLQSLHEKAFPFLDQEYMLMEFCRGLLKAGKFSLARNYLKGTSSVALATDKAENLVIQAAREYFFSASSISCSEIWKAKECLNIFPSSRNVRTEADIIDAVTVKLPNLGVNLLPMQFKQIKDPMEIIKLAITSQGGAYLNVDELIEIAKLLGLSSHDDISAVQEAIAREAVVAGDLQVAFDLCLVLAKKGHGAIWDLCAALARGPAVENMDVSSRKQLLGFALSYCDEESIGELLYAWKDLDMQGQCQTLMMSTETHPPKFSAHSSPIISYPLLTSQDTVDPGDCSGEVCNFSSDDQKVHLENIINTLSAVAKCLSLESDPNRECLQENGKILSFASVWLPWLIKLSKKAENYRGSVLENQCVNLRAQALIVILSWLARNDFAPKDDLIAALAKSMMEPLVTEEKDITGCSFLLNLADAFHGVKIIEDLVKMREDYKEISSIMNVGMLYSLLNNSGLECEGPSQRRELLLKSFQQKHSSLVTEAQGKFDKAHASFWREWKLKLEEQKRVAEQLRELEQILPGVDTSRFLSGDIDYMERVVTSLIESIKLEKKSILKVVLNLAHKYGLNHTKVLVQYINSVLSSEVWTVDDIRVEISDYEGEILASAAEAISTISSLIYPAVNGHDKERLAYIYSLLSACYLKLEERKELVPIPDPHPTNLTIGLGDFYKIIEQECKRVSFIKELNFKNIVGLQGLNLECFSNEVYAHIDEYCVDALGKMVQTLVGICGDPGLVNSISSESVYRNHILKLLTRLETKAKSESHVKSPENLHYFISELEQTYDICRKHINVLAYSGALNIMRRFFLVILPLNISFGLPSSDLTWQDCLVLLLTFWLRVADDMQKLGSNESSEENFSPGCLMLCLRTFLSLIEEGKVSQSQGWDIVYGYVNRGLVGGVAVEIFNFCSEMICSGCGFEAIAVVFLENVSNFQPGGVEDLAHLYSSLLETILEDWNNVSLASQNLHRLLSSLSKLEGDLEDLNRVRNAVWERMAKFSNKLQLPSHVRVHALELMQFIASKGMNLRGFSAELQAKVIPWDGWDKFLRETANMMTANNEVTVTENASSRFANTLVALKSSQLLSAISESVEITPDDLSMVESAVSCFLRVSEAASSEPQINTLVAILDEWEVLFTNRRDEAGSAGRFDAGNWSNDDWDEGWESLQEEPIEKEMNKEIAVLIHPLHGCWMEVFKKLSKLSRFRDVLKLMDRSIIRTTGTLLDEDGARSLSKIVLEVDCFLALKMLLLLPYEAVQVSCLDAVENKLKQGGISDTIGRDTEFLVLVLFSGTISTIITRASYGTIFSYFCYVVGNFSRQCQEVQLSILKNKGLNEHENNAEKHLFLFRSILFPCFIAELVKADQQILAGFLVTKFMNTNASLSLINVADVGLCRFLEKQLQVLQADNCTFENMDFCEPLVNTVSSLRRRLPDLIQTALSSLSRDVR